MPPKGWRKDQQENLDKRAAKATGEVKTTTRIIEKSAPPPEPEGPAVQDVTGTEKKKLPKIIIAAWDKYGNLTHTAYVCANITIQKDETTELSDGSPTKRKDFIHLVLEADVVGVE